jgi:serine protease AprX
MAAAVVSGAVADLLQAAPSLTPDQVKILLMQTASKTFPVSSTVIDSASGQTYTSYYDLFTVGAGYIDLKAAMAAIKQVPSGVTAVSPVANYDGTTGDVNLSFDPSSIFANKALWGTDTIFGSSVVTGNKALWGTQAVWGASSSNSSEKALWGTKSLWGTSNHSSSESVAIKGEE